MLFTRKYKRFKSTANILKEPAFAFMKPLAHRRGTGLILLYIHVYVSFECRSISELSIHSNTLLTDS